MQIHELPTISGSPSGGYFATDNGTQTTKIDYTALAQAIIEQYNASTLAGSAQSVKAALDGLMQSAYSLDGGAVVESGFDFDTCLTVGNYYIPTTGLADSTTGTKPISPPIGYLKVMKIRESANYTTQIFYVYNRLEAPYTRNYSASNNTWSDWEHGLNVVYGPNTIKTLTASDDLLSLGVGHYRINNAVPLNAPDSNLKYGFVTIQKRGATGYTYYEYAVGNGSGSEFVQYHGWRYSNSATAITWDNESKAQLTVIGAVPIPSNADLNNYTTPGMYYAESNNIVASLSNTPIAYAFKMTVEATNGGTGSAAAERIQRLYAWNNLDVYQRRYGASSGWAAWEKLPTRAEVDALSNELTVNGVLRLSESASVKPLTLTVPSTSRHLLILTGPYVSRGHAVYTVSCNASGSCYAYLIGGGDDMPQKVSGTGNTLTITSTSESDAIVAVADLVISGSQMTIAS